MTKLVSFPSTIQALSLAYRKEVFKGHNGNCICKQPTFGRQGAFETIIEDV